MSLVKKLTIPIIALVVLGIAYWLANDYRNHVATQTRSENEFPSDSLAPNDHYLEGSWQSREDPKFSREFKAGGVVTDSYQGDATATETGTYATVDPATEVSFPLPAESLAGMSVIRIDFPKSGTMYFTINVLT